MRLSIITPVLNSHEILRRQLLHLEKIGISEDTEIIIVDDGSEPALSYTGKLLVRIHATNDKRPWTWALARNAGARIAQGEYILFFDIDHIITKDCIDTARTFNGDKLCFTREFGVLLADGTLTQDIDILVKYGFDKGRLSSRGLTISPLPNNFAMRKSLFVDMGMYREDIVERSYPQGEDRLFKKQWCIWMREKGVVAHPYRPMMYMFPNGYKCVGGDVDFNPFGLFHNLSRKTKRNTRYKGEANG